MAWNDNDDDQKKDPWGGKNKPEEPPDLDAILRRLKQKLLGSMRGKPSGDQGDGSEGSAEKTGLVGVLLVIGAVIILWVLSGIFIIAPAERAAILRFGKYVETVGPGPHWIPRGIESRYTVDVQRVSSYSYSSEMLTKDENIVSVSLSVQYRVDNLQDYLFNIVDPISSLQQATASALRQVVGHTSLDDILTTGREQVRESVAVQLKKILDRYQSGLLITEVTLQPAKPPEAVTAAFDDAIKAREDQQTYINKANAYAKKASAMAQGRASRILQEARAYQEAVTFKAQADTASYLALLPEYERAPLVTRERLYLSGIESVLSKASKILVDVKGGNNVMYLPLDKIIQQQKLKSQTNTEPTTADAASDTEKTFLTAPIRPSRPSYTGGLY